MLNVGGDIIDDSHEVGNTLGQFYSDMSSSDNYRPIFRARLRVLCDHLPTLTSENEEAYNVEFTMDELRRSVRTCGKTSVGPDKIHYAFFKHLSDLQLLQVLKLFNYL